MAGMTPDDITKLAHDTARGGDAARAAAEAVADLPVSRWSQALAGHGVNASDFGAGESEYYRTGFNRLLATHLNIRVDRDAKNAKEIIGLMKDGNPVLGVDRVSDPRFLEPLLAYGQARRANPSADPTAFLGQIETLQAQKHTYVAQAVGFLETGKGVLPDREPENAAWKFADEKESARLAFDAKDMEQQILNARFSPAAAPAEPAASVPTGHEGPLQVRQPFTTAAEGAAPVKPGVVLTPPPVAVTPAVLRIAAKESLIAIRDNPGSFDPASLPQGLPENVKAMLTDFAAAQKQVQGGAINPAAIQNPAFSEILKNTGSSAGAGLETAKDLIAGNRPLDASDLKPLRKSNHALWAEMDYYRVARKYVDGFGGYADEERRKGPVDVSGRGGLDNPGASNEQKGAYVGFMKDFRDSLKTGDGYRAPGPDEADAARRALGELTTGRIAKFGNANPALATAPNALMDAATQQVESLLPDRAPAAPAMAR